MIMYRQALQDRLLDKPRCTDKPLPVRTLVKTRHLRDAMALALRDYVNTLRFSLPATTKPTGFRAVYRQWAKFEESALSTASGGSLPAAAVLPGLLQYPGETLSPRMDLDSWHRDEKDGKPYVLWLTDEAQTDFVIVARAASESQREAINLAMETAFTEPGAPGFETGIRKGRMLDMESYFGCKARFTLTGQQNLDSETSARENRWIAQFEVLGQATQAIKVPAPEFKPRVQFKDPE